ncbi:hypothetical protein DRF65_25685 [Chryseobacterium pennae]|uniref:Uncharacterized protein n=1 Tax=Chryseobacterium pennae TaxID=2258962 RepID=A0A3D9C1R2_9FLAO|nr:hypothetical protein [Chryseobacterium pennae]REC59476.1 hypothetical protein DRF65_25685 [Chryseobacterium pennae]
MKNLFIILCLSVYSLSYGQIGINTANPQGSFHVDGGKDNPALEVPTSVQQKNDFIITSSGNVGIGNSAPQRKLDIDANGSSLRITNLSSQSQTNNDILVKGNEQGDVTRIKYSYSATVESIKPGESASVIIPSNNIQSGILMVKSKNSCKRSMISSYIFSNMTLAYVNSVARDKVGSATIFLSSNGSSARWSVKFNNVTGCDDGGNGTQFDYSIVANTTNSYTITNNGNVAKTYILTFFKL